MVADKSIFGFDPAIGGPFDDSEMKMVEEWRGFKVGMQVGVNIFPKNDAHGKIVAVGEDAKYLNGKRFTAFAVEIDEVTLIATHKEIYHIV